MTPVATRDDLELRIRAAAANWKIDQPTYMAVDTETSGLSWWDEAFCVTLGWLHNGKVVTHYWELGIDDPGLRTILSFTPELVFHNAKFDMQKLVMAGLLGEPFPRVHDTQGLAHLLDEHRRMGLKPLAAELLGAVPQQEHEIIEWFKAKKIKKADRNYAELPREILIPYATMDVDYTIRLFHQMYPQVMADADLAGMYEMEMQLTNVLLKMEARGMRVDLDYLNRTAREYAKRGLQLEMLLRELSGADDFNPNSPKQILEAYARKGIKLPATNVEVLKTRTDEMAKSIIELRKVRKIHGTYLLGLLQEQRDALVHPWTRQFNTRTGRMASGGVE